MNSYKVGCLISDVFNLFKVDSSIVAGGYLRDLDLGRTPKDVDVLVEYESDSDYGEVAIQARVHGYSVKMVGNVYDTTSDNELRRIFKLEKVGELPIDVIFLNIPVMDRVADFPCNLSQIYRNSCGTVMKTPAYECGVRDKTVIYNLLTLRPNYEAKLRSYFPDWEHVKVMGSVNT